MFFSVITKNLNWEILTKNLVTFLKDGVGLRMKNFNIMGVYWKIRFLGGGGGAGGQKKTINRADSLQI